MKWLLCGLLCACAALHALASPAPGAAAGDCAAPPQGNPAPALEVLSEEEPRIYHYPNFLSEEEVQGLRETALPHLK
jgi:hypothetical protein